MTLELFTTPSPELFTALSALLVVVWACCALVGVWTLFLVLLFGVDR